MDYIINIHTTTETAIVNISDGENVIATLSNQDSKQHASFLHTAIKKILQENDINVGALKAIGVTNGPGSYTGIRVGLATAKGLAFSLKIPLISLNTLEVMAHSAIKNIQNPNALYCPMIDARRMEVFTAVYTSELNIVKPSCALVLDENSYLDLSRDQDVYFFGSGSKKFENISIKHHNHRFILQEIGSESISVLSWEKYREKMFENVAFAHPLYLKEFYTIPKELKK
jgi:tRNA threonylcarbamoyladenosine biosynthesis protein TsaB